MTQTPTRPRHPGHHVTAVLVCHDGQRWLPDVLDGLAAQTRPPDRFVAVDTGSEDGSLATVTGAADVAAVLPLPTGTRFGAAVQAALEATRVAATPVGLGPDAAEGSAHGGGSAPPEADDEAAGGALDAMEDPPLDAPVEWVWLLHDDCAPERAALDELLIRVTQSPSVWLVGPKVRSWEGGRLTEAGLTIDAVGHIDTGFDGAELDQGQRDDVDEVLAVGTAGALIRRDVWDRLGGLDPAWFSYADDVDLGWRVNAAGGRVVVATGAVVRHARAQSVGLRESPATTESPVIAHRRSGMQVVLTNTSPWLVPVLTVRYLLGGLLRAIGLLVIARQPARAAAEVRAVAEVLAHPGVIITGRRDRARTREVPHRELRRLLPSAAGRWRSSPLRVGRPGAERALSPGRTSAETGPVSEEAESLALSDGGLVRFVRQPATVLFLGMIGLALIADRDVLGAWLHGGRLLPSPSGASDLWSTYVATWHPSSLGSVTVAPPYLALVAALSSVALGKVWLVVDVLMLGAVPLAALSAYSAARALTSTTRIRVWVAIVYSLLPAVTGAVAGGRLDVVVAAIVLPQVIRAGIATLRTEPIGRACRRAVGAGLLLALVAACAPVLWVVAAPAVLIGAALMWRKSGVSLASLRRMIPAVIILVVPLLVLVPWTWQVITHPRLLVAGMGLPEFYTSHAPPAGLPLALLHAGGPAQPPVWIGIPIIVAALLGLTRRSRVGVALAGAALLVGGVALAVGLTRAVGVTPGLPASRHWPGVALLVAGAGALMAILVAATGARPALRQQSFGWRQLATVALVLTSVAATVSLAGAWLVRGAAGPLSASDPRVLPLFVQSELAFSPTTPRALVLESTPPVVSYALVRRPGGPQLGDADTAPTGPPSAEAARLDATVSDLVAGKPGAGAELAPFGIGYVVVPSGSAARMQSALGRASTLTVVPAPGATVWRSSVPTGELSVLSGPAALAAARGAVPKTPADYVLPASAGSADTDVLPGPPGRLAVLAEPANEHWQASLDGSPLTARTAYGWAQAFELPAGGGRLQIDFVSTSRQWWLRLELALVVVAVLASVAWRRSDDVDGAS